MGRWGIGIIFTFMSVAGAEELSTLDSMRSKLLTSAVSLYFNTQGYGAVENVTIDTVKRTISFNLFPQGESQKLSVFIGHYQTANVEKKDYLVLQKVETNRIWLNRIFADHMKDGIKIPLGTAAKGAGTLLLNL